MSQDIMNILIVGAGPTGLTLACALARKGIKCRIIDKRESSSIIPRAINISNPVLNIFENLNIGKSFWSDGLKLDELTAYWNKKRILNINYKYIETDHPYFFHLDQITVEKYLVDLLFSLNIKIEREVELINLFQKTEKVFALTKNSCGEAESDTYTYVIGCDGGNSAVRKFIGIPYQQQNYLSYFHLMDAEVEHNFREKKLHYYLCEEGYLILAPLSEQKYRMIFSFKGNYPGEERIDLNVRNFQQILDKRGQGNTYIKNKIWATSAGFYHKMAKTAKKDRVFLAGDALHQFSPVGGTNMNTGIQDAFNLAEKIIAVKNGLCNEEYLETYSVERMKVAEKILGVTSSVTNMLTRNKILPSEENKYLPMMKNRKFIKDTLPKLFSGMTFVDSN